MKNTKKILTITLCLTLALSLMGCTPTDKPAGGEYESQTETSSGETEADTNEKTSGETENVSETDTEPETATGLESETTTLEPSEEPVSSEEPTPEPSEEPDTPSVPADIPYSDASGYRVYDPQNLRGLDNTKRGHGFGYTSGGKRHHISIGNQNYFDSLPGVKALALDMKTPESDKVMYLTFDCGYEYQNQTQAILDILKEKGEKAAFFCTLDFIQDCPDTVQRMIDEGHIVGNHSTTHPVFPDISREQMAKELYTVDAYMKEHFNGYHSPYFRFPTGANSYNSLELCTSVGYRSVFWSIAHADWDTSAQKGKEYAFNKVSTQFHPGAVILLHTVSSDNVAALGDLIDYARETGYTFKTLDEYPW